MHDKGKPRVIGGRKVTGSLNMLICTYVLEAIKQGSCKDSLTAEGLFKQTIFAVRLFCLL